ncbi:unnamed protein product [Brugia timori]|uniref:Uncharacterized protein n=1 Tax=Brugia timori TaxID=42155 RepID=A0A0R3R9W6_9BILA|nr:unnamed protein product [Brugia timori]
MHRTLTISIIALKNCKSIFKMSISFCSISNDNKSFHVNLLNFVFLIIINIFMINNFTITVFRFFKISLSNNYTVIEHTVNHINY